jgi:hydrogenase maturation factor
MKICDFFKVDPLQLISSGALLISAKPEFAEKIIKRLQQESISASVIGEFLEDPQTRTMVRKNGKIQALPRPSSDHLWFALMR